VARHKEIAAVLLKKAEAIARNTGKKAQMDSPEPNPLFAEAERHIREGEERVARQLMLVNSLDAARRYEEARFARVLLATFTDSLDAAGRYLQIERKGQSARRPWNLQRPSR
jgi:hypothetical protein